MAVLLVDLSLGFVLLGLVSILRPMRRLGIRTRRTGIAVLVAGIALVLLGLLLPVVAPRLDGPRMALDDTLPVYQFGETHEIRIQAPPERVFAAVKAVTAREIRFFRLLTWLRAPHFGEARQSILNPAADQPILDVALRSGFLLLREERGREIVIGSVVCCGPRLWPRDAAEFQALQGSVVRAVMNFHVTDEGGGMTRLVTQTRVSASDPRAERRFAVYWRLIYPGSAFIRRMWLRAIRDRAELTP
jgi:hypothetical protein